MSPEILYILGAGRSGSTLLERLLGSARGVVAVGELHCLWRMPLEELTCSCGAPARACGFWRDVRRGAGLTDAALGELRALEHASVRHRRILGALGRLDQFHRQAGVRQFLDTQQRLFDAVADITGAGVIIDNSKAAPRGWALSAMDNVRIVHIRRRPGEVVAAWRRVKPDPSLGGPMHRPSAAAAAATWLLTELSAARLGKRRGMVRLDYDDLVASPEAALARIGVATDQIPWTGPNRFLPDADYHALNGNPDRFRRGEIAIRPAPQPTLPFSDQAAVNIFGAALERVSP